MKIQDLKTYIVGNPPPHFGGRYFIFLQLTTDTGITGVGEVYAATFGPHTVARMIEDVFARRVLGTDPFKIEKLWRNVYGSGYNLRPDVSLMGVLSGIEMACWDIIGKELNKPAYELLGGRVHERLRTYTYLYPEKEEGSGFYHDAKRSAARAVDFVKSIREAVGTRADLLFGTHGQFTAAGAVRLARRLEPYDPLWFEEPTPPDNPAEMARVARQTSIPIATGERLTTKQEFARVLETQAASILQMALGRVGGLLEAKKIAGMAEVHHVQIAPHLYCGPIEGAANIQISACSPNFLILEGIQKWDGFHAEILKKPIAWEDGHVIPPTAPGLGVELDEKVALAHPYRDEPLHLEMHEEPL